MCIFLLLLRFLLLGFCFLLVFWFRFWFWLVSWFRLRLLFSSCYSHLSLYKALWILGACFWASYMCAVCCLWGCLWLMAKLCQPCHCKEQSDKGTQELSRLMDCFATLAMAGMALFRRIYSDALHIQLEQLYYAALMHVKQTSQMSRFLMRTFLSGLLQITHKGPVYLFDSCRTMVPFVPERFISSPISQSSSCLSSVGRLILPSSSMVLVV